MQRAQRGEGSCALLYIDLDQFKIVNDTCGLQAGDRLLRDVTGLLQTRVRASDTIARLGGDEFGVLLENIVHQHDVDAVVARVQEALDQPFTVDGHEIAASASVGIAFASEHGPRPQDMLKAADLSMYQVKTARV